MRNIIIAAVLLVILAIGAFLFTMQVGNSLTTKETAQKEVAPTVAQAAIYLDLPASFPRSMPLPKLAKVTTSGETKSDWTATFLTTQSLDDALAFYEEELPKNGWEISYQSKASGLTILYTNKDALEAVVSVGKGDLGVTVSITILKKT